MTRRRSSVRSTERRPAPGPEPGTYLVTMSELEPDVCWRLVGRARFGRVAFVRGGEPWVLPVNCHVLDETVVFRTADGSMLQQLDGSTVSFEADGADRVAESGWSVLVRGRIREITDRTERAAAAECGLVAWGPGPRDHWMRVEPFEVTGRIVTRSFRADRGAVPAMPPD